MSHSGTFTHKPSGGARSPLTAAIGLAIAASAISPSQAQQTAGTSSHAEPRQLGKLVAIDTAEESIKVDQVDSPKFTQPLVDTPQTITVIPQEIFQQQGTGTLVEALANTPGITLQLGENGNTSAGDTFSIRGTSSQTNIFVDGIRDLGAITRDTFNTQQVEITKGAVGADYGRGATAGYINQVSKVPQADDFGNAGLSADTGVSVRATGDINRQLSDNSALRLNAVWQNGAVIGRDLVENNRWGFAPAIAFGLDTATRYYLYSQHVRADNVPDGGIPSIGLPGFYNATLATAGTTAQSRVDTENFYGRYTDFEKTEADMATLRIEHDFSDATRLTNSTRWGKSGIERALTGIINLSLPNVSDPTTWTVSRSGQSVFQDNKLLTNQTNLNFSLLTGAIQHDVAGGVEFINEQQLSTGWSGYGVLPAYLNGGIAINLPNANLYNPDAYFSYLTPNAPVRTGAHSDGTTTTYAIYAFDTLQFGERWLVTAGGRFEKFTTDYFSVARNNATGAYTITDLDISDTLFSWKTAVTFKPLTNGSVYVAYSNSLTPPGNDNFTLSSTATNINNPNFEPQEATNIEVGTKWDLLDARLALNAAVYRTESQNDLIQLDATTNEYVQYGKRRVQGAELGAVGKITDRWSLIAGLAWSDNEKVAGSVTGGNESTGATARWAPEYSANLWSTYATDKWTAGLGANYSSGQKRVVNPATDISTESVPEIPGYTVFNGMFSYDVNDSLGLQLNINNLFDKFYISSLNNGGARVRLGEPRNAQLTANFKF
jgi:catecholate siderophore receptor